jgi:SAM-dependent methyltransferase
MLNIRRLFRKVLPFFKTKNLKVLDVGAGGGIFLNLLKELGIESVGIEPSVQLARVGREMFGVNLKEGTLKQTPYPYGHFDLVTLLEVIEHLENPRKEIQLVKKYLKAKGMVFLVTPNIKSLSAHILGRKWWSFRQMHFQYFSPSSLDNLMSRAGFRLEWAGCFFKTFPIDYYLSNLMPKSIYIPTYINFNLCLSLGDMARLYSRNE